MTSSFTVLHLIDGLGTGGSERSLREMLPGLEAAGVNNVVACLERRAEGVEQEAISAGVDVRFLPAGRGWPMMARGVAELLREVGPRILHTTHFRASLAGRIVTATARRRDHRRPVVLTSLVNRLYPEVRLADPAIDPRRLRLARAIDGWTSRHLTDHFHAVSTAVAEDARTILGIRDGRVTVVERGRDPARFELDRPAARRRLRGELRIPEVVPLLLLVGRQEFQKGQRHMIEALARVEHTGERPPPVLLIAGRRGTATAELERLRDAHGLGERVRFLGHRDDVPELMAATDLLLLPSLYEGLPGAVVEAMAMGLPIIASDLPEVADIVENGAAGILVPPADAVALATAVSNLLNAPDRAAALARRGRDLFLQRFTLERSVARMAALYRQLAVGG